eukprot:2564893-Amphidinium_carterae.2
MALTTRMDATLLDWHGPGFLHPSPSMRAGARMMLFYKLCSYWHEQQAEVDLGGVDCKVLLGQSTGNLLFGNSTAR